MNLHPSPDRVVRSHATHRYSPTADSNSLIQPVADVAIEELGELRLNGNEAFAQRLAIVGHVEDPVDLDVVDHVDGLGSAVDADVHGVPLTQRTVSMYPGRRFRAVPKRLQLTIGVSRLRTRRAPEHPQISRHILAAKLRGTELMLERV